MNCSCSYNAHLPDNCRSCRTDKISHLNSPFIKSDNKCVLTSFSCIIFAERSWVFFSPLADNQERKRTDSGGLASSEHLGHLLCFLNSSYWSFSFSSSSPSPFPLSLSSTLLPQSLVIFLPWRRKQADKGSPPCPAPAQSPKPPIHHYRSPQFWWLSFSAVSVLTWWCPWAPGNLWHMILKNLHFAFGVKVQASTLLLTYPKSLFPLNVKLENEYLFIGFF